MLAEDTARREAEYMQRMQAQQQPTIGTSNREEWMARKEAEE